MYNSSIKNVSNSDYSIFKEDMDVVIFTSPSSAKMRDSEKQRVCFETFLIKTVKRKKRMIHFMTILSMLYKVRSIFLQGKIFLTLQSVDNIVMFPQF